MRGWAGFYPKCKKGKSAKSKCCLLTGTLDNKNTLSNNESITLFNFLLNKKICVHVNYHYQWFFDKKSLKIGISEAYSLIYRVSSQVSLYKIWIYHCQILFPNFSSILGPLHWNLYFILQGAFQLQSQSSTEGIPVQFGLWQLSVLLSSLLRLAEDPFLSPTDFDLSLSDIKQSSQVSLDLMHSA